MTVKLGAGLPVGDANGLDVISRALVDAPHRMHVVLAILDCKSTKTDNDSGDVIPTARIRRVEVVLRTDLAAAQQLMRRALETRAGRTVLPLDLEDEMRLAFGGIDPRTGEITDDGDDAQP